MLETLKLTNPDFSTQPYQRNDWDLFIIIITANFCVNKKFFKIPMEVEKNVVTIACDCFFDLSKLEKCP